MQRFYCLDKDRLFFGLTPWCDINIVPQFFYNTTSNQKSVNFGDFLVALDFQLLAADYTPYFPGIKFAIRETFPTGTFQRLNPKKLLTDQTGVGTFATNFGLVFYKVYHLAGVHWISTTISGAYTVNTPVNAHGVNLYGSTSGKALPGNSFQGIFSFEMTLSQNWAFAMDNVYTHTDVTQIYAKGTSTTATINKIPSSEQLSFAPAVEYNFSSNLGLCAGVWFTALGRNSTQFISGVVEFNHTY